MGYSKQTKLSYEDFDRFLQTIDANLTSQQKRYIFEKLDTDQSDTI